MMAPVHAILALRAAGRQESAPAERAGRGWEFIRNGIGAGTGASGRDRVRKATGGFRERRSAAAEVELGRKREHLRKLWRQGFVKRSALARGDVRRWESMPARRERARRARGQGPGMLGERWCGLPCAIAVTRGSSFLPLWEASGAIAAQRLPSLR